MIEFAKAELCMLNTGEDEIQDVIDECVMQLVKTFSGQGHSGASASYVLARFNRLANFLPLSPLTGEHDEWVDMSEYGEEGLFQNKRCSSVFKNAEGETYMVDGKIFSDDNGLTWYTSSDSRVPVEFPFFPPDKPKRICLNKG